MIDEGESAPVGAEAGVALDEVIFGQPKVAGDGRDLGFGDLHIPRPAAAVGAAFTKVFGGLFQEMKIKIKMKVAAET